MDSSNRLSGHKCQHRDDSRGWCSGLLTWWILPAHFVLVAVITIITLGVLQGRQFLINSIESSDSNFFTLYQSDVTTLLSLALVPVRMLVSCWITLTGWRMAFIILEKNGASLKEVSQMISYRLPVFGSKDHDRWKERWTWKLQGTLWLIFLLAIPSQIAAPFLTGAINWIPQTGFIRSRFQVGVTTPSPTSPYWDWHNEYQNNRFYEVLSASGIASIASPMSFRFNQSTAYHAPSRRLIPSLLGTTINSTLANVTVPYFEIHSLDWITSADQIESEIEQLQQLITNPEAPALNYSSEFFDNPIYFGTDVGRLVLINEVPWTPAPYDNTTSTYSFPPPVLQTAVKWVIVATQFGQSCAVGWSSVFGPTPGLYNLTVPVASPGCYVFARMNYTAGAMICSECILVSDGVVEFNKDSVSGTPIPDPLVSNAISMIPEVLFFMKVSNSSLAPSWQNIDGYTRGMITTAYQASWNSLANGWRGLPMDTSEISTPYPVLNAQITSWRVWVWFGLNLMMTISGLLLGFLQRSCENKTIRDPALAAIMLDTSAILLQDDDGLCNSVSLRKRDKSLRLRIKMSKPYQPYEHPRVEIARATADLVDPNMHSKDNSRQGRLRRSANSAEADGIPLL